MNIVVAKQTNIIGIVISVARAFVKPNIPNATVNAEKNSFRFFIYRISKFLFIDEIIISQNREQVNLYPVNNRKYSFYIAKCLSAKHLAFFIVSLYERVNTLYLNDTIRNTILPKDTKSKNT